MNRIEVDLNTGEQKVIELTSDEIAALQANAPTPQQQAILQIQQIEEAQPITQRAIRELMLAIGQAFPAAQASVFYQKAAAQEQQVAALRAKL